MKEKRDEGERRLDISRKKPSEAVFEPETTDEMANEINNAVSSGSSPLDASTKGFMESRFAHDFGRVRIHTGVQAANSARSVNALAYTVGNNIVFGEGQYRPSTIEGKECSRMNSRTCFSRPHSLQLLCSARVPG